MSSHRRAALRVAFTTAYLAGSGGKAIGDWRTIASAVRSVAGPSTRSRAVRAPNLLAATPRPMYPGEPPAVLRAPRAGESRGRADRAAPAVGEPEPFELWEGREEAVGQLCVCCVELIVLRPHRAVEMVGGVVTAPQDPTRSCSTSSTIPPQLLEANRAPRSLSTRRLRTRVHRRLHRRQRLTSPSTLLCGAA